MSVFLAERQSFTDTGVLARPSISTLPWPDWLAGKGQTAAKAPDRTKSPEARDAAELS